LPTPLPPLTATVATTPPYPIHIHIHDHGQTIAYAARRPPPSIDRARACPAEALPRVES
jgi:hypothetical protein